MRFLFVSDIHADASTMGRPRLADAERAVGATIATAKREKVDVVAFLGDLADPDSGPVVLRAAELLVRLALEVTLGCGEHQSRPHFIAIAGNHDVVEDGSGSTTLSPLRAVAQRVTTIHLHERPSFIELGDVCIHTLPFTATSHAYDVEAHVEREAESRGDYRKHVFLSHLAIPGIQPGEETKEMARGREVLLPLKTIRRLFPGAVIVSGHYHRAQVFEGVHVVGASARNTVGEASHEPSLLVLDV